MLYENQLIGYFIYQLGIRACRKGTELIDNVQLLQQTPFDAPLGDILTKCSGKFFLIEFKRTFKHRNHEVVKQKFIKLDAFCKKNNNLLLASKRCHFAAFGDEKSNILFLNYILLNSAEIPQNQIEINEFIDKISDDSNIGISDYSQFLKYISIISEIESSEDSSTGIIVNIEKNKAPIIEYYKGLKQLLHSLNQKNEQNLNQSKNIKSGKGLKM